jgi:D-glycero-D-manno-heptose 1,7-bisphosphate phosphatase
MMRAAFLDRDGVINRRPPEGQYVTRWEEMQILPGVPEAIALLTQAGFCVLTVSNQRCVAKGLLTAAELESIHKRMCQELAALGAEITEVYYCPHEKEPPCGCRKPAPGMLLTAARAHEIDLSASWMIGDSDIDIEAGRNAGCRTVRIVTGEEVAKEGADLLAQSLLEAVHQVVELESRATPPDRQARKLVR